MPGRALPAPEIMLWRGMGGWSPSLGGRSGPGQGLAACIRRAEAWPCFGHHPLSGCWEDPYVAPSPLSHPPPAPRAGSLTSAPQTGRNTSLSPDAYLRKRFLIPIVSLCWASALFLCSWSYFCSGEIFQRDALD